MTDWYKRTFGAEYLQLYAHRDEREARRTVQLIRRFVDLEPGSRILDAPCGAGRHARHFSAWQPTVGLDLSRELLGIARALPAPSPSHSLRYVRGDIRALPFAAGAFHLVANLFSSFGYFSTDEENADALCEFSRVTCSGGYFVIDYFNKMHLKRSLEPRTERRTAKGARIVEQREITPPPERVEKCITVEYPGEQSRQFSESVRLFSTEELLAMLTSASFEIMLMFGDYDGTPFDAALPRFIAICRKR